MIRKTNQYLGRSDNFVAEGANHLSAWLSPLLNRSPRSRQIWLVLALLLTVAIATLVWFNGPAHIMAPWDVLVLLDGGWRILSGQIPHTDFHNPVGPLVYSLIALGMRLGRPSLAAVIYGNLVFLFCVALWAIWVAWGRLAGWHSFLLVAFLSVISVASRPLGYNPQITSYAMLYNRYGWVLYGLLLVQLFVVPEPGTHQIELFEGLSAGLLGGLLFFCKINYFAFSLAAVLLRLIIRPISQHFAIGLLLGFGLVGIGFGLVLRLNPLNYIADLSAAGLAQSPRMRFASYVRGLWHNAPAIASLGVLALTILFAPPVTTGQRSDIGQRLRTLFVIVFCLTSSLVITATNSGEGGDNPIAFVCGLLFLEYFAQSLSHPRGSPPSWAPWRYGVALGGVFLILMGPLLVKDLISIGVTTQWRAYRQSPDAQQRFEAQPLNDFVIPATSAWPTAYWRASLVPEHINDGLALLRPHVTNNSRVFTLALTNPFAFALELPPPTGGLLWWDLDYSFNAKVYPSAAETFVDVDFVMIPILNPTDEGCCQETVTVMKALYGSYLADHFGPVAESAYWTLLEKRP